MVVASPLVGAIVALVLSARPSTRRHVAPVAALAAALMLASTIGLREDVLTPLPFPRLEPVELFGVVPGYQADRLARSFLVLLSLMGLGSLVASFDTSGNPGGGTTRHQWIVLLILAGCASLVLSANLLTAYLSWCVLDLAILLTIVLPGPRLDTPVRTAIRTLAVNQLAGLALLLAAVQAGPGSGIRLLGPGISPNVPWLLLLAALVRAGLYPLHLGLPLAIGGPAWRAAVLRLLSTTSGLYLVTRVLTESGIPTGALALVSGFSLVITGLLTWLTSDRECALSHATANQVALVVLSLTLDHAQTDVAALAATINLVLSIGLLFLTDSRAQVWAEGRAARWIRRLRIVAVAALVGVPPALGFVGRWGLYRYAVEQGLWLLLIVAALGSSFTFAGLLPLLRPTEGATTTRPGRGVIGAAVVLGAPFIALGLQPLLLSPAFGALGGPGTYQMLLELVRTTQQSVGVIGMAAILLPLLVGYSLDQAQQASAADLGATWGQVLHSARPEWLQQAADTGSAWLARLAHGVIEALEGERHLAWALLLGLLAILLLMRYV